MHFFIAFEDTGNTKVAQHEFFVIRITEEEIAWFDVFVDDIVVMAVCQCCGSLQGYTAELIEITVQVIVVQRATTQIFHQLIVTVFPVDIGLTKIVNLDNHLHADILDNTHQGSLDGEVGIVYLQYSITLFTSYQKNLGFTRIITQAFDALIYPAFQHEFHIAS